jgi:hypothetical protein
MLLRVVRSPLILGALAAWLTVAPVHGQVTLSGQLDLSRLVDMSSQRVGLRITYDESTLKVKVTIRQERPISDGELWQLTNRLLAEQGLASVRAGDDDTIAIVKIATAAQVARVPRLIRHPHGR